MTESCGSTERLHSQALEGGACGVKPPTKQKLRPEGKDTGRRSHTGHVSGCQMRVTFIFLLNAFAFFYIFVIISKNNKYFHFEKKPCGH